MITKTTCTLALSLALPLAAVSAKESGTIQPVYDASVQVGLVIIANPRFDN